MKDTVSLDDLDKEIADRLNSYRSDVAAKIKKLTQQEVKRLVKLTRQRAPVRTGSFKKQIASVVEDNGVVGSKGTWYVKAPDYRLTHLLVHGHQLRQGGRTRPNDFLEKSVEEVEKSYIEGIEKAVREG